MSGRPGKTAMSLRKSCINDENLLISFTQFNIPNINNDKSQARVKLSTTLFAI